MGPKHIAFALVAVVLAMGVPFVIAKNMHLGSYAKSPQKVEMKPGASTIVGGGRAKLWYAGGDTGADFSLKCDGDETYFQPVPDKLYEACGVTVEVVEFPNLDSPGPPSVTFEVTWDGR